MLADVSQSIPETGGGISGFVAHGLWHIYRHFPSSGRYDYLLLFVFLMVLARVLPLPYVVKAMKRDVARKDIVEWVDARYLWVSMFLDAVSIWVLVWFFHTDAGRTFLVRRTCFGQELTAPALYGGLAFFWFCLILLSMFVLGVLSEMTCITSSKLILYADCGIIPFFFNALMILAAHLLRYWSCATILLFWSYFVAVVLTEIIRITAVYILLRRQESSVRPD